MKLNKGTMQVIFLITIFSIGIGLVSLFFSTGDYGSAMFFSYFSSPLIAVLNILPIALLLIVFLLVTNRFWASFLITSIFVLVPSIINFYKIQIRNDPFVMKDLTLFSESLNMGNQFTLHFNWPIGLTIIGVCAITFATKSRVRANLNIKLRFKALLIVLMVSSFTVSTLYMDQDFYSHIENFDLINRWSQTQDFISKGFIYPFIHSFSYAIDQKPANYSDSLAKEVLGYYSDSDIPTDKKVDVIAIMLEAYNDFSKFSEVEFLVDVYQPLKALKKESYSGELTTNIFAGETVDTEWSFLTGYTHYHGFRRLTNSYVHYLASQCYCVEGSHPCYEWFYNRENVNAYLGFDHYFFYENHYAALTNNIMAKDQTLFDEIIQLHEKAKLNPAPYFSFNVTYQNHGPYPTTHTGEQLYIGNDNLSVESFNILNNYLAGINNTNEALVNLIDHYRDQEATVIILFGDHNPWLGDNNTVYHELGINVDLETEEGFFNYYNTPYLIWANDQAKATLDNAFIGEGNTIGPYFLMNTFFNLAGYEGNAFMKLSNALNAQTNLVHRDDYFIVNGELVRGLDGISSAFLEDFLIAQYYYSHHFQYLLE